MEISAHGDSEFLYHYTTREKLIEFILPKLRLKLNSLKNTNDPKEKMMHWDHSFKGTEFAGEFQELSISLIELIERKCRICCFSTDYILDRKRFNGYNLPRMWATYGDNHTGVCLVIDKKKFSFENSVDDINLLLRKVVYTDNSINVIPLKDSILEIDSDLLYEDRLKKCIEEIFFSKNIDWITEHEIRLVSCKQMEYATIKNSLVQIILGIDFTSKYERLINKQIEDCGKNGQIQLNQLKFNKNTGHLELI